MLRFWAPIVSKNRDRLIGTKIAERFLAAALSQNRVLGLMSDEQFPGDGRRIEASASMKSVRRKDGPDGDAPPAGRTAEREFRGEKRANQTNASTTDPIFAKNLETVQGDQRDVIPLSIGYRPDTPGAATMSMNFRPLNRKGGERRFNVAVTRARTGIRIFASFDPSMIDLTRTSAAVVLDLKHYLEFAQRGPTALGEALQSVGRGLE